LASGRFVRASKNLCLALSFISPSAYPQDIPNPIPSITQGDTSIVLYNGRAEKIRLYGIDCPLFYAA
jgi:endonuclease YncB( thermonuclease family)